MTSAPTGPGHWLKAEKQEAAVTPHNPEHEEQVRGEQQGWTGCIVQPARDKVRYPDRQFCVPGPIVGRVAELLLGGKGKVGVVVRPTTTTSGHTGYY